MKVIVTPKVQSRTFHQLAKLIKETKINPLRIATSFIKITLDNIAPLDFSSKTPPIFSTLHTGAIVLGALYALERSLKPEKNFPHPEIQESLANFLLQQATGLTTKTKSSVGDKLSEQDLNLLLLRTLCIQISLQGDFITKAARTLYLLELNELNGSSATISSFDPLFIGKFGCTTHQYLCVLLAVSAMSESYPILDKRIFLKASSVREKVDPILAAVLNDISLHIFKTKEYVDSKLQKHQGDALIHAYFTTKPLTKIDEHLYLHAPHPFHSLVATNGTWFRAIELAREDAEKRGSKKPWTNIYVTRMGVRFEKFLKVIFKEFVREDLLFEEYEFLQGQKGPDFFIFENDKKDNVIVVQAKLKQLKAGAFFGFSVEDFESDAQTTIAESIWKSIRYFYKINKAISSRSPLAEQKDFSEAMNKIQNITLLGIVPAMPSLFHLKRFRRHIIKGAIKNLSREEKDWFKLNKHRFKSWHIMDSEEIASFSASNKSSQSFNSVLNEYLSNSSFGELFSAHKEFTSTFRSWFIEKYCKGKGEVPKIFQIVLENTMKEVSCSLLGDEENTDKPSSQ